MAIEVVSSLVVAAFGLMIVSGRFE